MVKNKTLVMSSLERRHLEHLHSFLVFVCKVSEKARILIPLFSQNMTEFLIFSLSLSFMFQIILNFADEKKTTEIHQIL